MLFVFPTVHGGPSSQITLPSAAHPTHPHSPKALAVCCRRQIDDEHHGSGGAAAAATVAAGIRTAKYSHVQAHHSKQKQLTGQGPAGSKTHARAMRLRDGAAFQTPPEKKTIPGAGSICPIHLALNQIRWSLTQSHNTCQRLATDQSFHSFWDLGLLPSATLSLLHPLLDRLLIFTAFQREFWVKGQPPQRWQIEGQVSTRYARSSLLVFIEFVVRCPQVVAWCG